MFYLTKRSTVFLRLFDVGHIVKDHSARKWKPAVVTLHGLLFPIREV